MPIVDNPFDFGRIAALNAISDIFAYGRQTGLWRLRSSAGRLTKLSPGNCPRSDRRWTLCMPSGGYCAGWRSLHRCAGADFWSGGNGDRTDRAGEENSTAQAGCKLFLTKPLGIAFLPRLRKITAETRTSGTGDGSDVPDEHRRRVLCQHRKA